MKNFFIIIKFFKFSLYFTVITKLIIIKTLENRTFSVIGALGKSSPRRILSTHIRASGPSPSFRLRGRLGGVKNGSPVPRTIMASSGISAGGLRLLKDFFQKLLSLP